MLLEWSQTAEKKGEEQRVKITLTHEEIAQLMGTSRETVTRGFTELKKKQLIQVKGSTLVIRNRAALENLVNS